jgi:hypothetical protein
VTATGGAIDAIDDGIAQKANQRPTIASSNYDLSTIYEDAPLTYQVMDHIIHRLTSKTRQQNRFLRPQVVTQPL